MVDPKEIDTLSSELENRLDDLFGENDIQLPEDREKSIKEHYPLAELKNIILSIDWEITDEVLENLIQQLNDLQLTYEHDKIVTTFLQILNSLGNYIKTHRAKAHPKTFKILNSVFSSLDKVVLSKDMTEPAKKKILRVEMNRYKELREQISRNKTDAAKRKAKPRRVVTEAPEVKEEKKDTVITLEEPAKPPADAPEEEQPVVQQEPGAAAAADTEPAAAMATLADAVEELKRYIHSEINALKAEIQSFREQK